MTHDARIGALESDIPVPRRHNGGRWRFDEFEVGNTRLYETDDAQAKKNIQDAACQYGKTRGWKFATRSNNKGIRVWRVS